ncbi:hypothetical protein [Qingshengfaniella alkalisoli]|uniref:hypothetical protein n=1 Tax=Qingshengfaniella alkalisoli TaxID=2599296 RepID=UPI00143DCC6F|nr:hypothetical protein [Qingshengfaniella alkalisoli]
MRSTAVFTTGAVAVLVSVCLDDTMTPFEQMDYDVQQTGVGTVEDMDITGFDVLGA